MNPRYRQGAVFACGLLIGAAIAAWALMQYQDSPASTGAVARQSVERKAAPVQLAAAAAVARRGPPCPAAPSVSAADARDGQFELLGDLSATRATDVGHFIVIGKESAAAGHRKDAEVAFLMACRVAERNASSAPEALADAQYQLGWHYANVARQMSGAARDALVMKAESLYGESLQAYTARLGKDNEKTRFAARGLAGLKESPVPAVTAAVQAPPRVTRLPDSPNDTRVAGAAREPPQSPRAQTFRPSFDCAKARSAPERLICGDSQLAQLDRELGVLYAKVKRGAANAPDFRRRSDEEWRLRESICRDRQCLLGWYAHRRAELLDELDAQQRGGVAEPTAAR